MPEPPPPSAQVLAFVSQKGGVGKSTGAVALSAALADAGEDTLLVDCDHQASATLLTGFDLSLRYRHLGDALHAALRRGQPDLFDYVAPLDPRWGLLPAHISLAGLEMDLVSQHGSEWYLRDLLEPARSWYQWIILDAPPSLGMLMSLVLHAADTVYIPTVPDLVSEQGLGDLMTTIRDQIDPDRRRAHLPPLAVGGVFLSRVRAHLDVHQTHRAVLAAYCGATGLPFLSAPNEAARAAAPDAWIEIPDTISVPKAADAGKPITRYPGNGARKAYLRLAALVQEARHAR